jgi:cytoskeletal protein CcmA (bactofilin family)
MNERKETLIEQGTEFKGSFASDCPIVVKGRVEGDISAPSLVVSRTGAVSGMVKVKELRSEGELAGEYDADSISLSGRVKDQTVIRARVLEVKLAPEAGRMQVVFGECALDVGDIPSKEDSVAAATREPEKVAAPSQPPSAPSEPPLPVVRGARRGQRAITDRPGDDKEEERATSGNGTLPPAAP